MKSIALALVFALALGSSGCSFSKEGRQQRAYQKYIRKSTAARQKQRSKFRSDKPAMPITPMPSEPTQSTASGPEAMPADS
ncbi:MAG: hypothetical protein ABIR71_13200 [Chthoniobacterales bacterium]